jgi:protein TonB
VHARPRAPLAAYINNDGDYPPPALRRREQGTTRFRLTVGGGDGRVTNCSVIRSSGSSMLDTATCRIMRQRARFTPARDVNGNPASDEHLGEISWRLPE